MRVMPLVAALLLAVVPATAGAQAARPPHAHGSLEHWTFGWPKGDPARGRAAFLKFECFKCHEVKGERFPAAADRQNLGPELSQMGPLHEPAYFAEAILNPGATIEKGWGFEAPDGSSRMPSFNDSMTVQELVDLVAFLAALRPPAAAPASAPPAHRH
jgi:mono/diheme cytochrome c family protein